MQSPTSHHGSEKEHIGSDYFLTFLPLSLRLSWAGAWVTGGRDVCPLLGVGGRSCIGSAATSGLRALLRRRGLEYYGRADARLGVDFSTFLLLFCYSVVVCVAFVTFLLLFKVILFLLLFNNTSGLRALLLRRRGLNYDGRADARLSVGSLIFLPIRGDMTHLEPTLFRIFLSRDSNRHNWDAVSSFWESFFSSRSLQTSHQCLLEALSSDGSQIFRILSSRCSVWNFIR